MIFSDDVVPSFTGNEVSTDTKWVQNFQLPSKFSIPVTDALQSKGFMKSNIRNEFTRDVCSSIRAHTFYPTKTEREHVAMMIVKKYPFLAKIGSGNWIMGASHQKQHQEQAQVKTHNQCKERQPNQPTGNKGKENKGNRHWEVTRDAIGRNQGNLSRACVGAKKRNEEDSKQENVTDQRSNGLTFPLRRQSILVEPTAVANVMEEYPALGLVFEFKAEFGRVMGDKNIAKSMAEKFNVTWITKLLKLAKDKSSCKDLMEEMEEVISNNANKSEIKETVALMVLPILMKERGSTSDLLKVCGDDESIDDGNAESIAPRLVGAGEIGDISPLYIAGEGSSIIKLNNSTSVLNALVMLVGCYYIFNIEYPASTRNVFLFLEAVMLEKTNEVKKRVAINKFFQELE